MPPNPGAWLTITARNRAIDRIRRDATLAEKTKLLEAQETVGATMDGPETEETSFPDERLELIFTFQHCPVGHHWTVVTPVKEAELSDDERRAARVHHDIRLP